VTVSDFVIGTTLSWAAVQFQLLTQQKAIVKQTPQAPKDSASFDFEAVQECPAVATLKRLEPVRIFPTLVSRVLVYVTGNLRDGFQVYDYGVSQDLNPLA